MSQAIVINGVAYIPTREAIKLTDYTGDYVGQLAREKKIPSTKIGHTRYFDKDALIDYAREQQKLKKNIRKGKKSEIVQNEQKLKTSEIDLEAGAVDTVTAQLDHGRLNGRVSFVAKLKHIVLMGGVSFAAAAVLFGASHFSIPQQSATGVYQIVQSASRYQHILSRGLSDGLHDSRHNLAAAAAAVLSKFSYSERIAYNFYVLVSSVLGHEVGSPLYHDSSRVGLVVTPQDGASSIDSQIQRIKKSFSDEVEVDPYDETSGVVKPIFRDGVGDEYLYVMVPVPDD